MTENKIKVLVADEQAIVCEGLRYYFSKTNEIEVIAMSTKAITTKQLINRKIADILIVDIFMKDTGIPFLEYLQRKSLIKTLVYSSSANVIPSEKCIDLGVLGILTKEGKTKNLIEAIYSAQRDQVYLCSDDYDRNLFNPIERKRKLGSLKEREKSGLPLSEFEEQLMACLLREMTTKKIAALFGKSTRTIEYKKTNIMNKLGLVNFKHLLRWAIATEIVELDQAYNIAKIEIDNYQGRSYES